MDISHDDAMGREGHADRGPRGSEHQAPSVQARKPAGSIGVRRPRDTSIHTADLNDTIHVPISKAFTMQRTGRIWVALDLVPSPIPIDPATLARATASTHAASIERSRPIRHVRYAFLPCAIRTAAAAHAFPSGPACGTAPTAS